MSKLNGVSITNGSYVENKTNVTNSVNNARNKYVPPKVDVVDLSTSKDIMTTEIIDESTSLFDKFRAYRQKKNLSKDLSNQKQVSEYYDKDNNKLLVKLLPAGTTMKVNGVYVKTEENEAAMLDKDGNMQIVDLTQLSTKEKLWDGTVKTTNFDGSYSNLQTNGRRFDYNPQGVEIGGKYKDGHSYKREQLEKGWSVNKVDDGSEDYFKAGELHYTKTYDDDGYTLKYHNRHYGDDFSDDRYDTFTRKKDGTVLIKYLEGHTETRNPDKSRTVHYKDGAVKNFNSENKLVDGITSKGMHYTRTYNEDSTMVDKMEDGSEVYRSKYGSKKFVRTFEEDGTYIDKYDETHTITHKPDGTTIDKDPYTETITNPDGTKTIKYFMGSGLVYYFNKDNIVVGGLDYDGTAFTRNYLEDGAFIDKYGDGSESHYNNRAQLLFKQKTTPDGTVEKKFANGNVLKTMPNNETVLITPKKTIPCDKNGLYKSKKANGMVLITNGRTGEVIGGTYPDGKKFVRTYEKFGFADTFENGKRKNYKLRNIEGRYIHTDVSKYNGGIKCEYKREVTTYGDMVKAILRPDCVVEVYKDGGTMKMVDLRTNKVIGGKDYYGEEYTRKEIRENGETYEVITYKNGSQKKQIMCEGDHVDMTLFDLYDDFCERFPSESSYTDNKSTKDKSNKNTSQEKTDIDFIWEAYKSINYPLL